jgi:hypothetical protein
LRQTLRRNRPGVSDLRRLCDKSVISPSQIVAEASDSLGTTVAGDDEATKIRHQLGRLEAERDLMKAANAALDRGDDDALRALGISDSTIEILKRSGKGRPGYPEFALKMNAQKIADLKRRLKALERND